MQTQTKSLRSEAGIMSLESTNSTLPQINWIRSDVLRSLCLHQQEDRHYHRNMNRRSHYLRKGHDQHQCSLKTQLKKEYEMKNLGEFRYFLDIHLHKKILIDYENINQYKIWNLIRNDVVVSRDVVLIEEKLVNQISAVYEESRIIYDLIIVLPRSKVSI